jgi:hypothetical protein
MKLPVVYGVTHDAETGELEARVPRATKVAIGKPKDSGLHVYLAPNTDKTKIVAVLEIGRADRLENRTFDPAEVHLLKRDYAALMNDETVVKRKAPVKIPYFTFFKEAGDGSYIHDVDCIVKHGVRPREIEIIITEDGALRAGYEFWAKKGLNCYGDGRDGWRSVNFTPTKADEAAAEAAKADGRKWFPIAGGCFTMGCQFAKPAKNAKGYEVKQCGLHGSLAFQLVNDIRLGAKAEFSTTGGKSVRQLLASLVELSTFTGGGDPERGTVRGIPLVLSVGQFKTNHNNQPGTAYAVRLEFRAESVAAIQRKIRDAAETFGGMMPIAAAPTKEIAAPAARQITAAAETAVVEAVETVIDAQYDGEPADDDEVEAGFRNRQFGEDDEEDEGAEAATVETPEAEQFSAEHARLMAEAEAAGAGTEPTKGGNLFGDQAPTTYQDPGEQPKGGGRGVRFAK